MKIKTIPNVTLLSQEYIGEGCTRIIMSINGEEFKRLSWKQHNDIDWTRNYDGPVGDPFSEEEKINMSKLEKIFQTYCVKNGN